MGKAPRTAKGNTGGAAGHDKRKYLTGGEVQKLIPTCCATLAALPLPIKEPIPGSFRILSRPRKIEHTVKYTASNPARFEKLWK
jgi:hypothetical protein